MERETLPTLSACWEGYISSALNPGPNMAPDCHISRSKRSQFRAPFKNKPKSAVFWQSDKIKHARIFAVLRANTGTFGFSIVAGNQWLSEREYDGLIGIIWGSIWAYFLQNSQHI